MAQKKCLLWMLDISDLEVCMESEACERSFSELLQASYNEAIRQNPESPNQQAEPFSENHSG